MDLRGQRDAVVERLQRALAEVVVDLGVHDEGVVD
jgi:hypothetical protein